MAWVVPGEKVSNTVATPRGAFAPAASRAD